jgi:hypothetical protein
MPRAARLLRLLPALVLLTNCGGDTDSDRRDVAGGSGGSDASSGMGGSVVPVGGAGAATPVAGGAAGMPVDPPDAAIDGFGCEGAPLSMGWQAAISGACMALAYECERLPADVHIVLERSSAMLEPMGTSTKWDFARQGIAMFVEGLVGDSADLHLFGKTGGSNPSADCSVTSYVAPDVILEPGAPADETFAAIGAGVSGTSPSVPAVLGAELHADELMSTAERHGLVVLITAHEPDSCGGELAAAFASSTRPTHVIGLDAGFELDPAAQANGKRPFALAPGDAPELLRDALRHILDGGAARSCEDGYTFDPPAAGVTFDYELTRLAYDSFEVPLLASAAACSQSPQGGFYFDDPVAPTKVSLGPCSCARTSGCGSAQLVFFCKN